MQYLIICPVPDLSKRIRIHKVYQLLNDSNKTFEVISIIRKRNKIDYLKSRGHYPNHKAITLPINNTFVYYSLTSIVCLLLCLRNNNKNSMSFYIMGFETAFLVLVAKAFCLIKSKVILDEPDRLSLAEITKKRKLLTFLIKSLENFFYQFADVHIIPTVSRYAKLKSNMVELYNLPLEVFNKKKYDMNIAISQKSSPKRFLIAGAPTKGREIDLLKKLVHVPPCELNCTVYLACMIDVTETLPEFVINVPWMPPHKYQEFIRTEIDCVLVLYDTSMPINKFAAPNKIGDQLINFTPVATNLTVANYSLIQYISHYSINYDANSLLSFLKGETKPKLKIMDSAKLSNLQSNNTTKLTDILEL